MPTTYTYSFANDFGSAVKPKFLKKTINETVGITQIFLNITKNGDDINIKFQSDLTVGEKNILDGLVAAHDGSVENPKIQTASDGSPNTLMIISAIQTADRTITLPDASDTLVCESVAQTLTNKIIDSSTNTVSADNLHSATTNINVSSAVAPTSGQVLTATSSTAANWQSPTADVTGPGILLDKEITRFNGTTGKIIEGVGIRHYGASPTDPTSPTPQAGDEYYNTTINEKMCYDASRSKWLSITGFMDGCGVSGSTGSGAFYRRWNGMIMTTTRGPYIPKATITRIGFAMASAVSMTVEVLVNGSVVCEMPSGGSASAFDDTFNVDIDAGILSFRNKSGSSTATALQLAMHYKLRA